MAQETEDVRAKIEGMQKKLEDINYYELFEVDSKLEGDALRTEVTRQFRQLAKEWHVDRYDTDALGEGYRESLQEIFSAINTAYQVLTDKEKRTEYDMELSGENTDIGSILNAESAFRKGQNMLTTGAHKGAHEQFRIAHDENPDDLEYRAHFLYTEYLLIPKDESGTPKSKSRAQEIYDELDELLNEMPEKDWLLTFLGVVAMGLNRDREARALFNEALQFNPKNVVAKRQQRLLKMRAEREKNKGFFAKLMDKFK